MALESDTNKQEAGEEKKPRTKLPPEPPYTFTFRDKYAHSRKEGEEPGPFFSCDVRERGERHDRHLCEITEHRHSKTPSATITAGGSYDSVDYTFISGIRFPNKELAAHFFFNFCKKVKQRVETAPLSDLLTSYIRNRTNDLKKEEQFLLARFEELRYEWAYVLKIVKDNGLKDIIRPYTVTDGARMVKDLYKAKITVKGEKEEVPFFSETALYELVGKDTARYILAAVRDVARALAPNGRIEDCLDEDEEDDD